MDSWLTAARAALAREAGLASAELDFDEGEVETILDLARIAAHESGERTNAPLLCYLLGQARARGADLGPLAEAVRRSSS